MRNFISYALFPALVLLGIFLHYTLLDYQIHSLLRAPVFLFSFGIVLFVIELIFPFRKEWNSSDNKEAEDIGHTILSNFISMPLGRYFLMTNVSLMAFHFRNAFDFELWSRVMPVAVQVMLIYLIAEFGRYWGHRWRHTTWMWRFHVVHHNPTKLGVIKSPRFSIAERFTEPMFSYAILLFLGAPFELVSLYSVPSAIMGLIVHSNIDLKLGFLEHVINGPGCHRLHHSQDGQQRDSNYGSVLVVWDRVFGTYASPFKHQTPEKMGIKGDPVPESFIRQVLFGFGATKI